MNNPDDRIVSEKYDFRYSEMYMTYLEIQMNLYTAINIDNALRSISTKYSAHFERGIEWDPNGYLCLRFQVGTPSELMEEIIQECRTTLQEAGMLRDSTSPT